MNQVIAAAVVIASTLLIFRRVRSDYLTRGKLAPSTGFLEVLVFFLHGASSYLFLDSDPAHINRGGWLLPLALVLMIGGLLLVAVSMGRLGLGTSVGRHVTGLHDSGLYRHSRNPQIVSYFLVVVGYALLWPSWSGVLWIAIYMFIAHTMVRTEEEHLSRVYGDDYGRYCERVPRYIGIPRSP